MLKNSIYNLVGFVLRSGFTFLTIPVLIRLLGIQEYGLWALVSTVLGVLGLAEAGLSVSTTVFISQAIAKEDRQGISQALTAILTGMFIVASVAAFALWAFNWQILSLFPNLDASQRSQAAIALQWGSVVIWAKLLQQVMVGVQQARQRYDLLNIISTIQIVASTSAMLAIAYLGGKIVNLMQLQAITMVLMLLVHLGVAYSLLAPYQIGFSWNWDKAREIFRYSNATWVTSLGSALFQQGDRLIVGSILGTKLLGVYAAITAVTTNISTFSGMSLQPFLPRLSEIAHSNRESLESEIKRVVQANFTLVIMLLIPILVLAPWLIFIIFGEYNSEYRLALQLAAAAYATYSLNAAGYYALLGLGYATTSMVIALASSVFSLALIGLGAHLWGIRGAAIGNIGYALTVSYMILALKYLNIPLSRWIEWLKPRELYFFARLLINKTILSVFK